MSNSFPKTGRPAADVLSALGDARSRDLKTDGRAFAFVYDAGHEAWLRGEPTPFLPGPPRHRLVLAPPGAPPGDRG